MAVFFRQLLLSDQKVVFSKIEKKKNLLATSPLETSAIFYTHQDHNLEIVVNKFNISLTTPLLHISADTLILFYHVWY